MVNLGLALGVVSCLNWIEHDKIGLFYHIQIPYWFKVILGVIVIDFINYWEHRLNHIWGIFWRLHRVHHSDTTMDSSTSYRFHPLDALLDNSASIVAAILFGLDGAILALWLILYIPLLVLHHSNYIMPKWFDMTFGKIIVSPNFHKIHHHQDREYTDSNYGLMFIFWDKIFKTYKRLPVKDIKFGLKEFDEPGRQKLWFLLKSPLLDLNKTVNRQNDIENVASKM
ncbi:MAG: sterol desaturase family protein [Bacteroidota bacterium]|nr:sterol desaturase family protein [Bacteroidota bacterium]